MGTTGSGRFNDYPGSSGNTSGGGGDKGGQSFTENQCEEKIFSQLEEIERCNYYITHGDVPPVGSQVKIRKKLSKGRIGVETEEGELIGVLPTTYNYLRSCQEQGYSYKGNVSSSSSDPLPSVHIEITTE